MAGHYIRLVFSKNQAQESIFLARETGEMHLISSFPLSEPISVVRQLSCMTSKLQVQIVTPVRLTSNLQFLIIIFFLRMTSLRMAVSLLQ